MHCHTLKLKQVMHNISKKAIQELAVQFAELCMHSDSKKILEKARELYEMSVVFYHNPENETPVDEAINKSEDQVVLKPISVETEPEILIHFEETATEKPVEPILSVKAQIAQIMDDAAKNHPQIIMEFPQKEDNFFIDEKETAEEIIKAPEPLIETKKSMPQISREEEMSHSIPADIAADMFERLDKTETQKKSLNDVLSQQQIQIGLNDRIAFVKHLFDGNLADFNRVLSQLNSFETEIQAKDFLNNIVKADYNWTDKIEYELRLFQLIERKFL